jgi:radical SAM protein
MMPVSAPPMKQTARELSRENFARSPLLVYYEVTQACDLVCAHCRACAQTEPRPGELTTEQSLRLIDQLTEFPSPPVLVFTGGDPLKRADIFELVEYATSLGLQVAITPSATPLVTPWAIRRLRRAGISRMAVSLDGADPQAHDAVRGVAGSFDRTLEILAGARKEGIATQVNTTITPTNFDQIERMAELLAGQEIVMWSVFFLVPTGRASSLPRLSADQCEAVFERLWQQSQCRPYAIKTTEAPHYRRFLLQQQVGGRSRRAANARGSYRSRSTNDGKGVLFVSHAGIIHPSGFLPICCGAFPADHVVRVYQESPIFRGLRDSGRLEGKCHVCEFRHVCGGSRARAFAVTGNLYAEEPDCAFTPEAAAVT